MQWGWAVSNIRRAPLLPGFPSAAQFSGGEVLLPINVTGIVDNFPTLAFPANFVPLIQCRAWKTLVENSSLLPRRWWLR